MRTFNVGILGATGAVGQKFIVLLQNHPWFTVAALGASERSSGKKYAEAVNWIEPTGIPDKIANMLVKDCDPGEMKGVDFVFSGLDAGVATEIEGAFAKAGIPVISNAKNYRIDPTVPLLVPEVNPNHTALIKRQKFDSSGRGFIVTNPNCVAVPLVMALKPLQDLFGIDAVILTTMQSVSGAGYPGVPSMDILGNVIPFIGGEEEKIAEEPMKILGKLNADGGITSPGFPVHATATRVPTLEGHMLSVTVKLSRFSGDINEVISCINDWINPLNELGLPSAPAQPIRLFTDDKSPQPRRHSYAENGMQVSIGRLRKANVFDISFVVLGHNTIRGAAGVAILNAELLVKQEFLK